MSKIKTAASTVVLSYAAIQAVRGWYGLAADTIVYVKDRKKK